jgi:cation:H+ antiporter
VLASIALIAVGLCLLVAGGEALLRGAVSLATLARVTPAVIGLTVVAAGTSVPELAVSAVAATQGKLDIAVGNVVGSNIFNITFIIGLAALIRPLAIGGNTIVLEYPVLAMVTLLCVAISDHGAIHRLDGALFIMIYVLFLTYVVSLVRRQLTPTETAQLTEEAQELSLEERNLPRLLPSIGYLIGGVVFLSLGAQATVMGAVEIGKFFGMTERVIGLTIVAAGTGLPEIVTSLVSSIRGRDDVAVGNVIGSNLFNILGILGINSLIAPLPIAPEIASSDNWWMLGVTALLFPIMHSGRRINRAEGGLLLAVYVTYTTMLLIRP